MCQLSLCVTKVVILAPYSFSFWQRNILLLDPFCGCQYHIACVVRLSPAIVLPTILKPLLVLNVAFCQPDPSHHLTQFWHNNQCGILAWPTLLLLYFPCPISTIETALLWGMRQISLPLAGSESKRRVFAHLVLIFPSDIDGQSSDLALMVLAIISKVVVHDEACSVSEKMQSAHPFYFGNNCQLLAICWAGFVYTAGVYSMSEFM